MVTKTPNTIVKYDEQNAGFYLFVRDQFNVYQRVEAFNPSHHGQSPNYYVLDGGIPEDLTITGTGNTYLVRSTLAKKVTINDTGTPTVIGNSGSSATVTVNDVDNNFSSTEVDTAFVFDASLVRFSLNSDDAGSGNTVVVGTIPTIATSGGNGDAITYSLGDVVDGNNAAVSGFEIDAASGTITYKSTGSTLTAGNITLKVTASDAPVANVTVTVTTGHAPFLDNPQIVVGAGFNGKVTLAAEHLNYTDKDSTANGNTVIKYTLERLPAGVSITKDGTALLENGTFTQQDVIDGIIILTINESQPLAGLTLSVSINNIAESSRIHDFAILTRFDLYVDDADAINTIDLTTYPDLYYTITAGRGDDEINLNTDSTSGKNKIIYEYDEQSKTATDGGDVITGFKRGEDIFTLTTKTLHESQEEVLAAADGDNKDSFADNQFIITPDLKFTGGTAMVTGITLVFRENQTSSSGRMSDNSVQISFDKALSWDEFLGAIKIGDDANFDYNHLAVKSAVVLPTLLGEGSGLMLDFVTAILVSDAGAEIIDGTAVAADILVATLDIVNVPKDANFIYSFDDNTNFSIVGDNLYFKAGTYDADTKDSYTVEITATATATADDMQAVTLSPVTFTVAITDVNDAPPTLVLEPALVNNAINIAENETTILTVAATPDLVGDEVVYSIADPAGIYFAIDSNGNLTAKSGLDYENETDPKSFNIVITATTGTGEAAQSTEQELIINITNVFEVTSGNSGTLTNNLLLPTTEVVYTATADRAVTWGALSGADAGLFTIDSDGQVRFNAATTPTIGAKSSYSFTVTATDNADDTTKTEQDVTLTVEDILYISASPLTYSVTANIAPDAVLSIQHKSSITDSDEIQELLDDAAVLVDGIFGTTSDPASYTYVSKNSDVTSITFDFGDDTYKAGNFVLYNRISNTPSFVERINGAEVAFMLGEVPVVAALPVDTSNPDYDGLAYTIEAKLSDPNLEFDKVVLTFNSNNPTQNFSEIVIYGTKTIDSFSFDENVTESDSEIDAANYYFDDYNAATPLTAESFTIEGGDGKFGVAYNSDLEKFQLIAVAGANFNYETKSSYDLTITVNDGSDDSNAITVTANINDLNDPAAFGSEGRTGAITVGDTTPPSGTLTINDEDSEDSGYKTEFLTPPQDKSGIYGDITFYAETNNWSYQLDTTRAATIALAAAPDGAKGIDTFTVTDGGNGQGDITITVTGINDAPSSSNGEVASDSQEKHTFSVEDFRFTDPDTGDSLEKITIKSLPTSDAGTLTLNGTAVTLGQEIAATDIGNLVFTTNSASLTADNATASFTYSVHDGEIESGDYTQTLVLKRAPEFTTITPTNNYGDYALHDITDLSVPKPISGLSKYDSEDNGAQIAYTFRDPEFVVYSEFSITLNKTEDTNSPSFVGSTVQFYYDDVALGDAITITTEMETITIGLPEGYETAETVVLTHSSGDYDDFSVVNISGIGSVGLVEGSAGNVTPIILGTIDKTDSVNVTTTFSITSATSKRRDGGTDDLTADFDIDAMTGELSYIGAGIDQDIYSQAVKLVVMIDGDDITAIDQDVYVTIIDKLEPNSDWTAEIYDGIPVSKDHVLVYLDFELGTEFFSNNLSADLADEDDIDDGYIDDIKDNDLFDTDDEAQNLPNTSPIYPELTFKKTQIPDINTKSQYIAEILNYRGETYPIETIFGRGTATINVVKFYDTPDAVLANATPNDANTLAGDATARLIQGGGGNDTITGGSGGDLVIGGYGQDTITLGDGKDLVAHRFASAASGSEWTMTDGGDTINNFDYGKDKLLLIDTAATDVIANYTDFFAKADDAGAGTDPVVGFSVLTTAETVNEVTTYKITQATITMANTGSDAGNALTIVFKTGTGYELSASELGNFTQDANNTNLYDLNTDQYDFVQTILGDYGSVDIISDADFATEFGVTIV